MTIEDSLTGREIDTENPYELGEMVWYYVLYVDGTETAMCRGERGYKKLVPIGEDESEEEYTITTMGYKS